MYLTVKYLSKEEYKVLKEFKPCSQKSLQYKDFTMCVSITLKTKSI